MFPTLSFGDQDFTPQEMSARSAEVAGAMAAIGLKRETPLHSCYATSRR